MTAIDLSQIPVVDNHCHGLLPAQHPADAVAWRRLFTESTGAETRRHHVTTTLFYRRLMRELAAFLDCAPTEEAVLAARRSHDERDLIRLLLGAARIEALLVDEGYPPPDAVLLRDELAALAGCRIGPMLRLEVLMQGLIAAHDTLPTVTEALGAALADVRAQGYVALKTVVAYRTGLDIRMWPDDDIQAAFAVARGEVERTGALRLAHKPLLDTLLHLAFATASRQELPVQFHTGYGDTDADMLLANPLHLRAVLEREAYRGMPVVLLHECYPYTRQGGYLAAVYDNVYLDLSYGIPLLGYDEMVAFTRAACGVAPLSKLLYSSDGIYVPDIHWLGALHGRRILGQVLGEAVGTGELNLPQAEQAGEAILRGNATRLYGL